MDGRFKGEVGKAKRLTEAVARHRKGRDPRVRRGVGQLLQERDSLIDVQIDDDSIYLLTEETLGRGADLTKDCGPDLCLMRLWLTGSTIAGSEEITTASRSQESL